ncbi:MAG: hypothetical protein HZA25_03530 [Candidatus Niyogibacteria bacterium]|nr:hypothetical protein [Candidatus Niyogibacteria bacterium]
MKKLLFVFLVALSLVAARGAEASMDSGLFLFADGPDETIMVATGIWADDLADSAAVSVRLRYPLMEAIKNKLNKGESPAAAHSTMGYMYGVRRSATVSFFKSASMDRDEALIVLSRHSGTGSVPYDNFSAKASDLLKMSDDELKKWVDETASRMVAGWRSAK